MHHQLHQSTAGAPPAVGDPTPLHDLPAWLRMRAHDARTFAAAEAAAIAYTRAAEQLELALAGENDQVLSYSEAALIVGVSKDTVARAVRHGKLENRGRKNRPRVRKGDVLRAFPSRVAARTAGAYDPRTGVRSLLDARRGGFR